MESVVDKSVLPVIQPSTSTQDNVAKLQDGTDDGEDGKKSNCAC